MASSTTDHDDVTPTTRTKGHGTAVLGPSDSSDSGSDIQGGPRLVDGRDATAAPDIGDANLDSDSDRNGTGERAAAGRDTTPPADTVLRGEDDDRAIDGASIGDDVDSDLSTTDELVGSTAEFPEKGDRERGRH